MEKLNIAVYVALIAAFVLCVPAFAADERPDTVNINEASAGELALLPRVGPSLSARIVEFRDQNGKFKQPEDLMLVSGIGEKTFELMEAYVAVSGKTTLTQKVRVSDAQRRLEAADKPASDDSESEE